MKNISLVLNGVLLVAVIVLFYLHFSATPSITGGIAVPGTSNARIAYINSDTVLKYYDYFKVTKSKLEAKNKQLDQDLQSRAQSLQNEITSYQRNLSSMTIGQAKAVEEDLGKKQQNFRLYQQSLEQQLVGEQSKINEDLYGRITNYLKQYGKDNGLDAVLKFDTSSDLLYGNPGNDITTSVIKGLNDLYLKDPGKNAPDSAAVKKK